MLPIKMQYEEASQAHLARLRSRLWALAVLHAVGIGSGLAAVRASAGWSQAWGWGLAAGAALVLQWIYLVRRLHLNHRPGEQRLLPGLGLASWISLVRGLLLACAVGFAALPRPQGPLVWAPMALFTTALLLDLLDGHLARRADQVTQLGEALELGLDSLAMLVGSGLAVRYGTLPWWYLSFGLASPIFRLGLWWRSRLGLPLYELPESTARRWVAGFSMGFLSAALWPIVSPAAAAWVGPVILAPFLAGFLRDWAAMAGWLDSVSPAFRRPIAAMRKAGSAVARKRLRLRHLLWLAGPALIWLVLRDVPLGELTAVLRQLAWWELAALALANLVVVVSFSGRWWGILRSLGQRLPYGRLVGYRLAAFALSYFTPGPHFGGEPLQVYSVHRREAVPLGLAAASVLLEKTVEMLVNFAALALCVLAIARLQLVPQALIGWLGAGALGLLLLPLIILLTAAAGARPISWIARRTTASSARWHALLSVGVDAERQFGEFCSRRPAGLLRAIAFSLVSWLVLLGEYWLALRFLGLQVGLVEALAVIGAARLAILLPLPGGLGALEASQVLALSGLGYSPAQGAALALIIRARDVVFGGAGLVLGLGLARPLRESAAHGARLQF